MNNSSIKAVDIFDYEEEEKREEEIFLENRKKDNKSFKFFLILFFSIAGFGGVYSLGVTYYNGYDAVSIIDNGKINITSVLKRVISPKAKDLAEIMPASGFGSDLLSWDSKDSKKSNSLTPPMPRAIRPVENNNRRLMPKMPSMPVKNVTNTRMNSNTAQLNDRRRTVNKEVLEKKDSNKYNNDRLNRKIMNLERLLSQINSRMLKRSDLNTLNRKIDKIEKNILKIQINSKPIKKPKVKKRRIANKNKIWILRSAKPGLAWVSKKGSSELKAVSIGDTLDSIGEVKDIFKSRRGYWQIKGSSGVVTQ